MRGGETLPDKLAAKELSHLVSDTLEQDVLLLSKLHFALSQTFLSLSPLVALCPGQLDQHHLGPRQAHRLFPPRDPHVEVAVRRLKHDSWQVRFTTMGDKNTLCKTVDMVVRLMVDRLMEQMLKSNIKQEDDGDEVERGEPEYLVVVMSEIKRAVIRPVEGV